MLRFGGSNDWWRCWVFWTISIMKMTKWTWVCGNVHFNSCTMTYPIPASNPHFRDLPNSDRPVPFDHVSSFTDPSQFRESYPVEQNKSFFLLLLCSWCQNPSSIRVDVGWRLKCEHHKIVWFWTRISANRIVLDSICLVWVKEMLRLDQSEWEKHNMSALPTSQSPRMIEILFTCSKDEQFESCYHIISYPVSNSTNDKGVNLKRNNDRSRFEVHNAEPNVTAFHSQYSLDISPSNFNLLGFPVYQAIFNSGIHPVGSIKKAEMLILSWDNPSSSILPSNSQYSLLWNRRSNLQPKTGAHWFMKSVRHFESAPAEADRKGRQDYMKHREGFLSRIYGNHLDSVRSSRLE
jgi:hypothetical protein